MSDPVKNGLPLGLRFYDSEDQLSKEKYTCLKGVSHQEYQYTDSCTVPPFQVMRPSSPILTFKIYIICVGTGDEYDMDSECPDMVSNLQVKSVGLYDYITYFATHTCCNLTIFSTRALVTVRLEEVGSTRKWYSEEFYIDPSGVDVIGTSYRLWMAGGIRKVDLTDLRIHS
jgi:hypothetical protein